MMNCTITDTSAPRMELLAPAGGPAQAKAALAGGADAIYCGLGASFNARRSAVNFTDESFAETTRLAHLLGARVYVTTNVVIREDEMDAALDHAFHAWQLGADALIVQDMGLFSRLRSTYPQIECHISTQANIHDARGVLWCANHGAERVTLSRELSLPEIARIAETGVDVEVFGHGAICVCYSGVCLLSSMRGGRSANRGQCAQPCRLPYELVDEAGTCIAKDVSRPLCPRDNCTVDYMSELLASGAASLKLEGRMKSADYVLAVTRSYREAIDKAVRANEGVHLGAPFATHTRLARAFNRGFTTDYLLGRSDNTLMSYDRSNNRGQEVGTVVASHETAAARASRGGINGGRPRHKIIKQAEVLIALTEAVGAGDLLEIRPISDPTQFLTALVREDAPAGSTITVIASRVMEKNSVVRLIRSQEALDAAEVVEHEQYPRRRAITMHAAIAVGKPFVLEVATSDGAASVRVEEAPVEAARTKELTVEEVVEHLCRLGSTPFAADSCDVDLSGSCGMSFSYLHKVRARAIELLEEELLQPYSSRCEVPQVPPVPAIAEDFASNHKSSAFEQHSFEQHRFEPCSFELCAVAERPSAERLLRAAGFSRIYATTDVLETYSSTAGMQSETWQEAPIPLLDEVCREIDHDRIDPWIDADVEVVAGNISELACAAQKGAQAEVFSTIPVHNSSAITFFETAGACGFWLSPELALDEMGALARVATVPVAMVAVGHIRTMTTEHCILQAANACIHDCKACKLRRKNLFLKTIDGDAIPVRTDLHGRSRLYTAELFDAMPYLNQLAAVHVRRLVLDTTFLTDEEISRHAARMAAAVQAFEEGGSAVVALPGSSVGHLFSRIG